MSAPSTTTPDLVDRLMGLWSTPLPEDDDVALRAFADVYADPLELNGTTMALADLVVRARGSSSSRSGCAVRTPVR